MSAQMNRLLQILVMLPRSPKFLSVEQIHRKLDDQGIEVSIRTVQRDMNDLEAVFRGRIGIETYDEFNKRTGHNPIGDSDRSNHWFWTKDAPIINLAGLTINQSLSLTLLKNYLVPLFPKVTLDDLEPFFDEAARTLQTLDENPLTEWPRKIAIIQPTQPLLMPEVKPKVHEIVSEALLTDRQLRIHYRHSNGEKGCYQINPLGLVLRNGSTYLIASNVDTEEPRPFVLHRIRQAEQLDMPAIRPTNFDLQRFIDEGHMGFNFTGEVSYQPIKLKAIYDPITANHLSESKLSEDQTIEKQDDDHYLITATVQETEQLFWWLLSFGFRVEVLEPLSLRQKIAKSVRILADKYEITSGPVNSIE